MKQHRHSFYQHINAQILTAQSRDYFYAERISCGAFFVLPYLNYMAILSTPSLLKICIRPGWVKMHYMPCCFAFLTFLWLLQPGSLFYPFFILFSPMHLPCLNHMTILSLTMAYKHPRWVYIALYPRRFALLTSLQLLQLYSLFHPVSPLHPPYLSHMTMLIC